MNKKYCSAHNVISTFYQNLNIKRLLERIVLFAIIAKKELSKTKRNKFKWGFN